MILSQGAEAILSVTEFAGRSCVLKVRVSKKYRVPQLDIKINKTRFNQEVRCIAKCVNLGVNVPTIYFADMQQQHIYMEYIQGDTLKNVLRVAPHSDQLHSFASALGAMLARMHTGDVFHGDLTTSNIMVNTDGQIVLIDFGLAVSKCSTEDKAVDLYVLERSFISSHPEYETLVLIITTAFRTIALISCYSSK